ncbi:hypothetical protein MUP51_03175 [Candidatus Bathyarchaeota archaeon]|nr:hypothetical protein [Candidatus Bathyarchaeota archaeon]
MDYIQTAAALLIAGESAVLYLIMKHRGSEWVTPINHAYVVIDVVAGLILLASGLGFIPVQSMIIITSALIHGYRDYEVYQKLENRYAFNTPTLIILNIRLLALAYIILV